MPSDSEERYQVMTLVVATSTVLLIIFYALIFLNPRIAFNPFKPPIATTTLIAAIPSLPATWTPTLAQTATPTTTPTQTATATPVIVTSTPAPSSTPTVLPTVTPTARPATRTPQPTVVAAQAPTAIPLGYTFRPVSRGCSFGTPTQIKGKVASGGGPIDGVRVRLATSSDVATVIEDQTVKRDSDTSTIYAFIISPPESGSFDWHVWVVDQQGKALSDPNFHVTVNSLPGGSPDACRIVILDFAG